MTPPWAPITFAGVFHQDPVRVFKLLEYARPWFTNIMVGIQTDEPDDDATLVSANEWADRVIVEPVKGLAEPTLHALVALVPTEWVLIVSADEWPSESLLASLGEMVDLAEAGDPAAKGWRDTRNDGWWIPFISSIDGIEYPSEQDRHLRLFRKRLGWPGTMHSRPPAVSARFWPQERGYIRHDRSLDEMMLDYLRYLEMSGNDRAWLAHNRLMMHDACTATAMHKGWEQVTKYPWWPTVEQQAFDKCMYAGRCVAPDTRYDCFALPR